MSDQSLPSDTESAPGPATELVSPALHGFRLQALQTDLDDLVDRVDSLAAGHRKIGEQLDNLAATVRGLIERVAGLERSGVASLTLIDALAALFSDLAPHLVQAGARLGAKLAQFENEEHESAMAATERELLPRPKRSRDR